MTEVDIKETVLPLFKNDLGISFNTMDEYFIKFLSSRQSELEDKGIILDAEKIDDVFLLTDYAAWMYRKRTADVPLAENLKCRIRNRIIKNRASFPEG